jgi:DNA-binding transcriptional MerR regulator
LFWAHGNGITVGEVGVTEPGPVLPEEVRMPPEARSRATDRLDDDDYPAFTMGRAAEMIGATPAFLRAIGEARLITPLRSEGGHRRYSRYQLRVAARARELVDAGTPIESACRIIILEDQLEEALRLNEQLRQHATPKESANGSGRGDRERTDDRS